MIRINPDLSTRYTLAFSGDLTEILDSEVNFIQRESVAKLLQENQIIDESFHHWSSSEDNDRYFGVRNKDSNPEKFHVLLGSYFIDSQTKERVTTKEIDTNTIFTLYSRFSIPLADLPRESEFYIESTNKNYTQDWATRMSHTFSDFMTYIAQMYQEVEFYKNENRFSLLDGQLSLFSLSCHDAEKYNWATENAHEGISQIINNSTFKNALENLVEMSYILYNPSAYYSISSKTTQNIKKDILNFREKMREKYYPSFAKQIISEFKGNDQVLETLKLL